MEEIVPKLNRDEQKSACMKARRYAELFAVAKAAADTIELLDKKYQKNEKSDGCIKFDERQLKLIITHFCINAIEAVVNYLGYIFDDVWEKEYERKNFWKQYARLIRILSDSKIDIEEIKKEPFENFKDYYRKIRNQINHVHSSEHDYKKIDISDERFPDFGEKWAFLEKDEAINLPKKVEKFITDLRDKIDKKSLVKSISDKNQQGRQDLLDNFLCPFLTMNPFGVNSGNFIPKSFK